jgi:cell filamentation protein
LNFIKAQLKSKALILFLKFINICFKIFIHGQAKKRLVEISKNDKQFFPISHFENAFRYIDQLIADFKKTPKENKRILADKLAEILDTINYLHPFREGNGRAQREFLRLLALEKNLILNLNPPDNINVYKRYMKGTIESDVKILSALIFELIQPE